VIGEYYTFWAIPYHVSIRSNYVRFCWCSTISFSHNFFHRHEASVHTAYAELMDLVPLYRCLNRTNFVTDFVAGLRRIVRSDVFAGKVKATRRQRRHGMGSGILTPHLQRAEIVLHDGLIRRLCSDFFWEIFYGLDGVLISLGSKFSTFSIQFFPNFFPRSCDFLCVSLWDLRVMLHLLFSTSLCFDCWRRSFWGLSTVTQKRVMQSVLTKTSENLSSWNLRITKNFQMWALSWNLLAHFFIAPVEKLFTFVIVTSLMFSENIFCHGFCIRLSIFDTLVICMSAMRNAWFMHWCSVLLKRKPSPLLEIVRFFVVVHFAIPSSFMLLTSNHCFLFSLHRVRLLGIFECAAAACYIVLVTTRHECR
jgi:hypothetical protein